MKEILNSITSELKSWFDAFIQNTPNIILALIVFFVAYAFARKIRRVIAKLLEKSRMRIAAKKVIANFAALIFVSIGLFFALSILNLNDVLTTILAGAGVMGLAIGLALQGTLSNTFSGIELSFIDTIKIGDWIESNNFAGEVVDINLRITTIKQPDNNLVTIPNKKMIENTMKNHSLTPNSMVILTCGISYNSDLEYVKNLVVKTIKEKSEDYIKGTNIIFFYYEFGESSINFELRFLVKSLKIVETLQAKGRTIELIKKTFDEQGVKIPFPTRTLEWEKSPFN